MNVSFRHSVGFGKRMEYKLIGDMLMEGLDCYVPLVDDHGVDSDIERIRLQKKRKNTVTPSMINISTKTFQSSTKVENTHQNVRNIQ